MWGLLEKHLDCKHHHLSLSLQYNISPQPGEVPKSRSLERKQPEPIVLTKWRHSTYVLDLNDKVGQRPPLMWS